VHLNALTRGPLNFDGRCFRIGNTAVVWPHGYHASNNPPRVIDDAGHVFARPGQVIDLGGGGAPTNLTPEQLVAEYPPLRQCLPKMGCYVHPNAQYECLNDVWFG
jgi:hypothetical protein